MPGIQSIREPSDVIVMWTSPKNGARCVLAFFGDILQLRLERDGKDIRHARYNDIRPACHAAQRWRIEWDIEAGPHGQPSVRMLCPECGDDGLEEWDSHSKVPWFRCPSCGESWTPDDSNSAAGRDRP
jgi:hypothetical protein